MSVVVVSEVAVGASVACAVVASEAATASVAGSAVVVATRYAGRATTASAIVATVPSVAHAAVTVASTGNVGTELVATVLIEATASVHAPAVSATVGDVEVWTSEVEVVAARIAGIDAEVPVASLPEQGTVEIGCGAESLPLPGIENVAQVQVAALPIGAEHIVTAGDAHQIVEIDLVGGLILSIGKVQLIGHLVGQEQGFAAGLFITHGVCLYCYRQYGKEGKHQLLHSRIFF